MSDEPARPHLRIVDGQTGEIVENEDLHQTIHELERELRTKRSQLTKAKNENKRLLGLEPEADDILDVLQFWRPRCMPGASIVIGSERWIKTSDRLKDRDAVSKELVFSPLKLKGAVVGVLLSDYHVKNKYLDASTIFKDPKTVEGHIARATGFKRTYGASALTIVDELGGESLRWLAERCGCSHTWLAHLRGGEAAQGGAQACSVQDCGCPMFDHFHAQVERFMKEQE